MSQYYEPQLPAPIPDWREIRDPSELSDLLVAMSLHEEFGKLATEACVACLEHKHTGVQRAAVISLGHVARVRGLDEPDDIIELLQNVAHEFPVLAGSVEDAIDDITMFRGR